MIFLLLKLNEQCGDQYEILAFTALPEMPNMQSWWPSRRPDRAQREWWEEYSSSCAYTWSICTSNSRHIVYSWFLLVHLWCHPTWPVIEMSLLLTFQSSFCSEIRNSLSVNLLWQNSGRNWRDAVGSPRLHKYLHFTYLDFSSYFHFTEKDFILALHLDFLTARRSRGP